MKIQILQLFFQADTQGGHIPADNTLFTLASDYAAQYMKFPVDFKDYRNTWVACEVDEEGQPIRVHGLLCLQLRADFPICRFTDNAAVVKLVQRANDHLHDVFGARGSYALVHIPSDEAPEDHCPNHFEWMKAYELKPADRWMIKIK